jgi:putative MFS transporter
MRGEAVMWLIVFGLLIQVTMPVLYTYTSELFPTELRASGFGWTSTASRVATGLSPFLFGALLWPYLGLPRTFMVLALAVIAAVIWMLLIGPETRGRDLDEIGDLGAAALANTGPATEEAPTSLPTRKPALSNGSEN